MICQWLSERNFKKVDFLVNQVYGNSMNYRKNLAIILNLTSLTICKSKFLPFSANPIYPISKECKFRINEKKAPQ